MDGNVFFYDLALQMEIQTRNSERDFNQKGVVFTGLANIPGQLYEAIVVGNDRHIYSTSSKQSETRFNISQVAYLNSGKVFFAAVGEEKKPGSIQIWKSSLDKVNEV